jgi:hypothetical protein
MALLFVDGFDHSGTSSTIHQTKYTSASGGGAILIVSTPVRTGTGALRYQGVGGAMALDRGISPIAMGTAFITGFAYQKAATPGSVNTICLSGEAGVAAHIGVAINTAGQLFVYRGTTATALATGSTVLANNAWYYIELKGVIHDTTGSYELRLDGATELTATNVDTRNGGSGVVNTITLNCTVASINFHYDDFYICDGTGSAPTNTFLGAIKVETLLPQTDAVATGSNAGLTPSTGTDHGALVDENPPNTTDYNSSPTVGVKDTYQYPPMALTGTIVGVQTNLYVAKSDATARSVCAVVRTNSVDYDGANVNPTTSFTYLSEVRALNPNSGVAWTTSDIASIQAGMKVTV